MDRLIDLLNTIFWGCVLIYGLLAVGIYFTIRLGLLQILHFGEMIRTDQRRAGVEPVFHARDYPELGDQIDHSIWTRDGS